MSDERFLAAAKGFFSEEFLDAYDELTENIESEEFDPDLLRRFRLRLVQLDHHIEEAAEAADEFTVEGAPAWHAQARSRELFARSTYLPTDEPFGHIEKMRENIYDLEEQIDSAEAYAADEAGVTYVSPEPRESTRADGGATVQDPDADRTERYIDGVATVFEDVQGAVDEFVHAARRGELEPAHLTKLRERLVEFDIAAEDAADATGAINGAAPQWRLQEHARHAFVSAAILTQLEAPVGSRRAEEAREAIDHADALLGDLYDA